MATTPSEVDMEAAYRLCYPVVRTYVARLTSCSDRTEDIVQETFYRAFRSVAGFRGEATLLTWLCRIARNVASTEARRSHVTDAGAVLALEQLSDTGEGPEMALISAEERASIAATLSTLPTKQQMAILLRDSDGLSYQEIADILGLSLTDVKVTIHRARVRFRAEYLSKARERES